MAGNTTARRASRAGSSPPITIYLLCAVSIAIGISVHVIGLQSGPFLALPKLALFTPVQLRQQVFGAGWKTSSKWTAKSLGFDPATALGQNVDAGADFALRILLYFRDHTLSSRLGKALLLALTGYLLPLSSFMITEPLKPTRDAFTGILFAIWVLVCGQIVLIGAAAPVLFVPSYALRRVIEARTLPQGIHPLPAPNKLALALCLPSNLATLATILGLVLVPISSPHFMTINMLFQIFPLFYLPLLAWPLIKVVLGVKDDGGATGSKADTVVIKPNKLLVDNYALIGILSLAFQIAAIVYAWPFLQPLFSGFLHFLRSLPQINLASPLSSAVHLAQEALAPALSKHGDWLLLIDCAGIAATTYLIVAIDHVVDDWIVNGGALSAASTSAGKMKEERTRSRVKRVHSKRFLLEDLIMGLPLVVLLGPGVSFARYLQRRETLAEKARFEEATVTGQLKQE